VHDADINLNVRSGAKRSMTPQEALKEFSRPHTILGTIVRP